MSCGGMITQVTSIDRPRNRQKRDSGDQTEAIMTFDRRRFIRLVSAASTVAAPSLLQACAPSAPSPPPPAPPTNAPTPNPPAPPPGAMAQKPPATHRARPPD